MFKKHKFLWYGADYALKFCLQASAWSFASHTSNTNVYVKCWSEFGFCYALKGDVQLEMFGFAPTAGSQPKLAEVERVRSLFPETWIWLEYNARYFFPIIRTCKVRFFILIGTQHVKKAVPLAHSKITTPISINMRCIGQKQIRGPKNPSA